MSGGDRQGQRPIAVRDSAGPLRIWRSPYSNFNRDETLHAAAVYTDAVLDGIRKAGFTAIWIHGLLRDLVPSPVFPELGKQSAAHLRSLRTVIRRAAQHRLQVYLYMQPPRGFPADDPFWKRHPDVQGALQNDQYARAYALCTSHPDVQRHVRSAAERLSRRLPGLGGVILITASEYQAHCYSRYNYRRAAIADYSQPTGPLTCPRCAPRHPSDVVAEVIQLVRDGLHQAGDDARVIAWNWSWTMYEPDPGRRIIRQLPPDVTVMADFERGGRARILGKFREIDEYSIAYAGPSPRFSKAHGAARQRGLKVMAKLQFGTTHELATVPNLPLIGTLYDKARGLRRLRVTDYLGCWNFGNMLTANTAAMNRFLDLKRLPLRDRALRDFASDYFPGCEASLVVSAWQQFEQAMRSHPFSIPFLYFGPVNYAVILPIEPGPLKGTPPGGSWIDDPRGDDLTPGLGPYTLSEVTRGLGELTARWEQGVAVLHRGLAGCRRATRDEELSAATAAGHCFHSAWNQYRAFALRRKWSAAKRSRLAAIAADERAHLEKFLPILESDPRLGFHSECQVYQFDAQRLRRKLKRLAQWAT